MNAPKAKPKLPPSAMRASLLDLAKDLFSQRGYVGSSLRDLADATGITPAAVYYHFAKKEDLLHEIIFHGLEDLSHLVLGAMAEGGTPREQLEALVRAHFGYIVQFPRESRIIIEESRFLSEVHFAAAREKQLALLNAYRACLRQMMDTGAMPIGDPSLAAFGIISVIGSWYRWYREDGPVSKDEAFEYMIHFTLAGVLQRPGCV